MRVVAFLTFVILFSCADSTGESIDPLNRGGVVTEKADPEKSTIPKTNGFVGTTDYTRLKTLWDLAPTYSYANPIIPYLPIVRSNRQRPGAAGIPAQERELLIALNQYGSFFKDRLSYGDRVDIIGTFNTNQNPVVMTLLQNVTVSGVYDHPEFPDSAYLGLLATLDEAELLVISDFSGTLTPIIRNPKDVEVLPIQKKRLPEVLQEKALLQKKRQKSTGNRRGVVLPIASFPDDVKEGGSYAVVARYQKTPNVAFTLIDNAQIATLWRPAHSFFALEAAEIVLSVAEAEGYLAQKAHGAVFDLVETDQVPPDVSEIDFLSAGSVSKPTKPQRRSVDLPPSIAGKIDENGILEFAPNAIASPDLKNGDLIRVFALTQVSVPENDETGADSEAPPEPPEKTTMVSSTTAVIEEVVSKTTFRLSTKLPAQTNVFVTRHPKQTSGNETDLKEALSHLEYHSAKRRKLRKQKKNGYEEMWLPVVRPKDSINAGERIDILGTYVTSNPKAGREVVCITLMQNVTVLDVSEDGGQINAVQLEVQKEEAELLALSMSVDAKLEIVRRNREDVEVLPIQRKTVGEVLQELELIKKKRKMRRRSPKKKSASISISAGDGSVAAPSNRAPTQIEHPEVAPSSRVSKSTFSVDVDTTSYAYTRWRLSRSLNPTSIRTEEFINAFDYRYADPAKGEPFAVHVDGSASPFVNDKNTKLVRIGLQAKRPKTRRPSHLIFLVDTSGSMGGTDRLDLAKSTLIDLTKRMQKDDRIALVTFSNEARVLLPPTGVQDVDVIHDRINALDAHGGTAMGAGLTKAYSLAEKYLDPRAETRVIIASDGDTNIGARTPEQLYELIEGYLEKQIFLSIIGFGASNLNDATLEFISNKGNGNYHFVGDRFDADWLIKRTLNGTLDTVAKDVKVQVQFDNRFVKSHRLIGYENRKLKDKDFRNDQVDAGEVGSGHSVTALYEVVFHPGAKFTEFGEVLIRYKEIDDDASQELRFEMTNRSIAPMFRDANDSFRFAAAIAGLAEFMRHNMEATIDLDLIEQTLRASSENDAQRQSASLARNYAQTRLRTVKR